MKKSNSYSSEFRERAVRMVLANVNDYPSEWAAIKSIAPKIGCVAQTLHTWVRTYQTDQGQRPGQTKEERENRELRKAERNSALGQCVFYPGGARPSQKYGTLLLTSTVTGTESSRSVASSRALRPVTTCMPPKPVNPSCEVHAPSRTNS